MGGQGTLDKRQSKLDDDLGFPIEVSSEHHLIHEGNHYMIADYAELATGGDVILEMSPSGVDVHMVYLVNAQSEIELGFYEGTSTSGGTAVTARNNNRTKPDDSSANPVLNPTIDSQGTLITSAWYGNATSNEKARATGHGKRDRELVLGDGNTYTFEIISKDDANVVSYMAQWYEVES